MYNFLKLNLLVDLQVHPSTSEIALSTIFTNETIFDYVISFSFKNRKNLWKKEERNSEKRGMKLKKKTWNSEKKERGYSKKEKEGISAKMKKETLKF